MADINSQNSIEGENSSTYFSLEDIISEYSSPMADFEPPKERSEVREQSRRIVLEAVDKSDIARDEVGVSGVDSLIDDALSEVEREKRAQPHKSRRGLQKWTQRLSGVPLQPEPPRERKKLEAVRILEDDSDGPAAPARPAPAGGDSDMRIAYGSFGDEDDSDVKIAPDIGTRRTAAARAVRITDEDGAEEPSGEAEPPAEEVAPPEAAVMYGPNRPTPAQRPGITEYEVRELLEEDEKREYASAAASQRREELPDSDIDEERRGRVREKFGSPLLSLLALITMRIEQRRKADSYEPTVEQDEAEDGPEMPPKRAVKFYASQLASFSLRTRLALAMSLVGVYITFAFDTKLLPGALGDNLAVASMVLMIILLAVIVAGLDVFTAGVLALIRKRPTFDTLAAASCVFSIVDAAFIASGGGRVEAGLPLCAVSALSLTFALWGASLTCRGYRSAFRVLTAKRLWSVSAEKGVIEGARSLVKSAVQPERFITKSEEADPTEYAVGAAAPVLLAASLIFSLLASVLEDQGWAFLHCLSLMTAVSAVFSGPISFALPFSLLSRKLSHSGAAIAGWSGLRDIGRSKRIVLKDEDVFTPDAVQITGVRVLENASSEKVISYAGSVAAASGGASAGAFAALMRSNGYLMKRIESFEAHDGGGMTAVINGESVYIGNGAFMNLMGIRVPQKLNTINTVYAAISGKLVALFTVEYRPAARVQRALVELLRSKREMLFAIRDFNITPLMLKKKFRMQTEGFDFPPLSERFRVSDVAPDEPRKVSAVTAREGIGAYAEIARKGRRVYIGVQALTALSIAASAVGLVTVFLLCRAGAFDSATAKNVLTFMLLWLVPTVLIGWGAQR